MTKILIVHTNVARYQGTDEPTGLWLGESAEFVNALATGIGYDFVSPKGGFVPLDPRSMRYTDAAIMARYEDPDFIERGLVHTLRPDQVDPADYAGIYYTGGHGVMWDFPQSQEVAELAARIYAQGGIVSSVCHGIAGLLPIVVDRQPLLAGKKVTGFTKTEEVLAGKLRVVPFLNKQAVTQRGGQFSQHRFYSEYAVQDGRVITGQNPFCVNAVAKLVLAALAS